MYLDNPKSINDLILMDTSSKKYSQVMDHTLSLRQSELDLLTMTTQWFSKMINYTNNLEWLKYIVSKIWAYLSYQKWYIMQIDIGNSKLKQVSDPSWMDINFNEKVDLSFYNLSNYLINTYSQILHRQHKCYSKAELRIE